MRSKERDNFEGCEATSILKPRKDLADVVLRLGDEAIDGGGSRVGTTSQELKLGSTL